MSLMEHSSSEPRTKRCVVFYSMSGVSFLTLDSMVFCSGYLLRVFYLEHTAFVKAWFAKMTLFQCSSVD